MAEKPAKPVRRRRPSSKTKAASRHKVGHAEIAERAYFIHLDEASGDAVGNWLRAERELTAA